MRVFHLLVLEAQSRLALIIRSILESTLGDFLLAAFVIELSSFVRMEFKLVLFALFLKVVLGVNVERLFGFSNLRHIVIIDIVVFVSMRRLYENAFKVNPLLRSHSGTLINLVNQAVLDAGGDFLGA